MNTASPTVAVLLARGAALLAPTSESPRLESEVLLADTLGKPRSALYAWPERSVGGEASKVFQAKLARRRHGEPIAYILARREFWSLELEVTPDTLIPRPETELLVEQALARLAPMPQARLRLADLGTGSGAIALAIARERPQMQIVATDISAKALAVARRNAQKHAIDTIAFRQGDWLDALALATPDQRFDMIVCNPPYVAADSPYLERGDARFEPRLALLGGDDGWLAINTIVTQARSYLSARGWLLLEHGFDQGEKLLALLRDNGFRQTRLYRDAAGLDRISVGQSPD